MKTLIAAALAGAAIATAVGLASPAHADCWAPGFSCRTTPTPQQDPNEWTPGNIQLAICTGPMREQYIQHCINLGY
jgi:hypothetical protein